MEKGALRSAPFIHQPRTTNHNAEVPDSQTAGGGIAGAVVFLRRKTETFHCVTDSDSGFLFSCLRPGTWVVHVKEGTLPDHTHVPDQDHTVELDTGDHQQLELSVVPVIRTLIMQENGETLRLKLKP
ncbi:MAG: hypothetical protein K8R59_15085 [Thermoanaerobaculales bacterium]|nr:hypothetical protein [Thermoanaerobaculales bacterium]